MVRVWILSERRLLFEREREKRSFLHNSCFSGWNLCGGMNRVAMKGRSFLNAKDRASMLDPRTILSFVIFIGLDCGWVEFFGDFETRFGNLLDLPLCPFVSAEVNKLE